jgi:hypothetical protein
MIFYLLRCVFDLSLWAGGAVGGLGRGELVCTRLDYIELRAVPLHGVCLRQYNNDVESSVLVFVGVSS